MSNHDKNVEVCAYNPEFKELWDGFVSSSKNGVFLFYRDYMEYHSDRFQDHSLLFFESGKLVGLLPANINGSTLYSHGGLTFGGIVTGYDMKISLMLKIFEKIILHCKKEGLTSVEYKAIPYIYHSIPADEDLYALFRYNAKLRERKVSSAIYLPKKNQFERRRKEIVKKAKKSKLIVKRSFDLKTFMKIVADILAERHEAQPVHTAEEIELLANRFPNNIKLFASHRDNVMLAGILVYESQNVAHGQYAANSTEGRNLGAQDIIEDYLINEYYKDKKYFDFGTSIKSTGNDLDFGLIRRKESFGARTIGYDIYELPL